MATFPTGLYNPVVDDITEAQLQAKTTNDATYEHTVVHRADAAEILALETKLGITSSADTASFDYFLKHASGAFRTHKHDGTSDDGSAALTPTSVIFGNSNGSSIFLGFKNAADSTDAKIYENLSDQLEFSGAPFLFTCTTDTGMIISQANAQIVLDIDGSSTTHTAIDADFNSLTTGMGLSLRSSSATFANTTNGLLDVELTGAGTGTLAYFSNANTHHGLYILQSGVLAASSYGLAVYSNATQINSPLVYFAQDGGSSTQNVLSILNDGTGYGQFIDQNGNSSGLVIDCESTSAAALVITGKTVITSTQDISGGYGMLVTRNLDEAGTNYLASFINDHVSDTAGAVQIQNDGTGYGLFVDQGGNKNAILVDSEATTQFAQTIQAKYCLKLDQDISSGYGLLVTRDIAEAGSSYLVQFVDDNATSTVGSVSIQNDGTGYGLFVDQNGNNSGVVINCESTSYAALVSTGKYGIVFTQDISNGYGLSISRNITEAGANPLVTFGENNTTSSQNVLNLQNSGSGIGMYIYQIGVQASGKYGLYVYSNSAQVNDSLVAFKQDSASATKNVLDLINDGTGYGLYIDQNGDKGSIFIDSESTGQICLSIQAKYGLKIDQDISGGYGMLITRDIAEVGSNPLLFFVEDNSTSTQNVLNLQNDGTGNVISIDWNNCTGASSAIKIDADASNANDMFGISMNLDNAGAGSEYAFYFGGSEIVSAAVGATQNKKIRISVGGVDYYIALYTT